MREALFCLVFAATLGLSGVARADSAREAAEAALTAIGDTGAALAPREVAEAKRALERARGARESGDAKAAERLEAVARMWAETARDVAIAKKAEDELTQTQQKTNDAREKTERERALLEERLAERGRAEVDLKKAEAEAKARAEAPKPAPKHHGRPKGKKK